MDDKQFKKLLREQSQETARHQKMLLEEFSKRTQVIAEMQICQGKKVEKISEKLDATFELAGNMSERLTRVDERFSGVENDVRFIRNNLSHKVDHEEFESLEKRVIFLERKIRTF